MFQVTKRFTFSYLLTLTPARCCLLSLVVSRNGPEKEKQVSSSITWSILKVFSFSHFHFSLPFLCNGLAIHWAFFFVLVSTNHHIPRKEHLLHAHIKPHCVCIGTLIKFPFSFKSSVSAFFVLNVCILVVCAKSPHKQLTDCVVYR